MATYKKPASMETSSFLDKEGQFHFLVNNIDEQPISKKDNSAMDGIKVELSCIGGNEPSQVKRLFDPILFNPSEAHRDGGEFATRIHLRLADACCLLGKANAGDDVEIDWSKAKGSQIVAFVKLETGKDGKARLGIDGAHIYHVDDPEVAHVPKNEAMLKLLPADRRRAKPAAAKAAAAAKPAATGKPAPTTPATTVTPVEQTVDLDNI